MTIVKSLLIFLLLTALEAKPINLLLDPTFRGNDEDQEGAFILEVTMATLSNDGGLSLVDRQELSKVIKEQELGASGFADSETATKLGQLLSANYITSVKGVSSKSRSIMIVRTIDVATSKFRSQIVNKPKDAAIEKTPTLLIEAIKENIKGLSGEVIPKEKIATLSIAPNAQLPPIALYIPESTEGQRVSIDPACEHFLMNILLGNKFKITQLPSSSHAIRLGENGRPQGDEFEKLLSSAREKEIEILIIGEAFSEKAGNLGSLFSSRARVELHALRVSDQKILSSTSCYGTGLDAALSISGKKAIEDATQRCCAQFISEFVVASQ